MVLKWILAACLLLSFCLLNADTLDSLQATTREVFNSNKDCIVRVYRLNKSTDSKDKASFFVDTETASTGFFVSQEGHILTARDVSDSAEELYIQYQGSYHEAHLIGYDPITGLAALKPIFPPRTFKFIYFDQAQSNIPDVSSFLFSIGCKITLDPAPKMGLVTAFQHTYFNRIFPTSYLRSTLKYFSGEGGSPVFNDQGSFAGMLLLDLPTIEESFVIPARALAKLKDDLIFLGKANYAYFGFEIDYEAFAQSNNEKVVVSRTLPKSPAEECGMLPGDQVLEISGQPLKSISQLFDITFFSRPGKLERVKVLRKGETKTLNLIVGEKDLSLLKAPLPNPS